MDSHERPKILFLSAWEWVLNTRTLDSALPDDELDFSLVVRPNFEDVESSTFIASCSSAFEDDDAVDDVWAVEAVGAEVDHVVVVVALLSDVVVVEELFKTTLTFCGKKSSVEEAATNEIWLAN